MKHRMAIIVVFVLGLGMGHSTAEGSDDSSIALVVAAGRPLRVSLDQRERVRGVGQPVTATLVEPVYSYDRIVLPAGTKVRGRVEKLEGLGKSARLRAALGGDFTPLRHARLQFNALVLPDGAEMRIASRVKSSAENVSLQVAKSPKSKVGRAREEAARQVRAAIAPFKEPGKWERLKNTAIAKLPYHPQYLNKGTVYTVELLEPLNFGEAVASEWAPAGAPLPPEAILAARLITALDSSTTPRGTPIRAVLTQPLFSTDQRLILPEGTELQGEVTFTKHAKRFRRNGELRFLFESVHRRERAPEKLMASLHSTELSKHVAIDEEGGTRVTNPKTRFVAPVLSVFALRAARDRDVIDAGEVGNAAPIDGANVGGRAFAGFFGLGLVGTVVAQISRPVATTLGFIGLAETFYRNLLGKGSEVVFPADTSMKLQLSPGPTRQ